MCPKNKNLKKSGGFNKQSLKNSILGVFSTYPKHTFNYKQLARQLLIKKTDEKKLINEVLYELKESGNLQEVYTGKFKLKSGGGFVLGKVDLTKSGYAYIVSDALEEDVFVSQINLKHALDGDTVKVYLFAHRKSHTLEGEVVEIIERSHDVFVGIVEVFDRFAFFTTESRQLPYDLFIPLEKLKDAKTGQKVVAKITDWPMHAKNPFGEIIEVLGEPGNNDVEMHAILAEFGLPIKFPEQIEQEAENISDTITEEEIQKRRDFRKVPTFTIDPEDAKDFDDALSIQKLSNGNWEVGVHIADVSFYVRSKTLLDEEAQERATSIYLVDRVIPMLPEKLSNNLCSLRPNEEKLCFSAVFELNDNADIINEWFGRTIIYSNRRFSYQEAQEIIETGKGDLSEEILKFHELAQILRNNRFKNGSIAFERDEVKFELDKEGKPLSVFFKVQKESNQLIEEFMLLANKQVASLIGRTKDKTEKKTFVYRIHDKPSLEKLASFSTFITRFGHSISLSSPKAISDTINKLLKDVKGKKEQDLIENLALRSMAKAEYSTENIGHYGLAFKYYTHFTSPIRRYPDILVHRLLAHYLDGGESKSRKKYEKMCRHSSEMELRATDAERASVKYKQVEFMVDKIGQEFEGIISGVTEWGIYVEIIENKCEGMVSMRDLVDDYFEYDEDNYCLIGKRTRKKYQLGDHVKVEILRANLPKKQLDFALVD
ncbi:MAG: ribonuclease R [Bacteroidales bacterium]|nr:ribonuclease R [Bacteroidales bacterium]